MNVLSAAWLPYLLIFVSPLLLLILIAVKRNLALTGGATLVLMGAALISLVATAGLEAPGAAPLVALDGFTAYFTGLFLAAGLAIVLFSFRYLQGLAERREEFFVLLFLVILGSTVLVASRELVSFFLGLEILSVSLYALIGYPRSRPEAVEAGLKYLILAAVSAAFLLFGLALFYADSGTLTFEGLARGFAGSGPEGLLGAAALALVVVGVGFKLALVPFHMWTPDVYQGAPAPVTALIASVSKGALFGFLLRFFALTGALRAAPVRAAFIVMAILSMTGGNLLALAQKRVKRLLAYSSIAHLGYLLIAFLASGRLGIEAATFYLAAYFVTIVGSFGVVSLLSPANRDADGFEDFRGLFWRRPAVALVFTAMLLSLAGIPLTAGFLGKFYLLTAGAGAGVWLLVFFLIGNSVLSLYYYIRVIVALYSPEAPAEGVPSRSLSPAFSVAAAVSLAALLIGLIWLGVFPSGLIDVIRRSAGAALGL